MANSGARRHGVVAVIRREQRFLMIRRSLTVSAPGAICFPGGGIEAGETEEAAIVRELREEIDAQQARPQRRLWTSITPRGVHLAWWAIELAGDAHLTPIRWRWLTCSWWTQEEMERSSELLQSNREFLDGGGQRPKANGAPAGFASIPPRSPTETQPPWRA